MTHGAASAAGVRLFIFDGKFFLTETERVPYERGVHGAMVSMTGPAGPSLWSAYVFVVKIEIAVSKGRTVQRSRRQERFFRIIVTREAGLIRPHRE